MVHTSIEVEICLSAVNILIQTIPPGPLKISLNVFSLEIFTDLDECYNVINREYVGMFISLFKNCGLSTGPC